MCRSYEGLVKEFHRAFDRPVRDLPEVGSPAERVLRVRLMLEELLEFAKAAGIGIGLTRDPEGYDIETLADLDVYPIAYGASPDLSQMAHELADLQYVVSGTAVQLGIPLQPCVEEIHMANMRKLGPDGRPIVDANGKVRKPEGWQPANVEKVLAIGACSSGYGHCNCNPCCSCGKRL